MSLFKNMFKSKEQVFWNWLIVNKTTLEEMKNDPTKLMLTIAKQLDKYYRGLSLEIGVNKENIIELTISANGIKALFKRVKTLVSAAPELEGWEIFAFRQIKPITGPLLVRGLKFQLEDIKFKAEISRGYFDIVIYHKELNQENFEAIGEAAFLMMDRLIGEYDVATKIAQIDFQALPEDYTEKGIQPLEEIKKSLEEFYAQKVND